MVGRDTPQPLPSGALPALGIRESEGGEMGIGQNPASRNHRAVKKAAFSTKLSLFFLTQRMKYGQSAVGRPPASLGAIGRREDGVGPGARAASGFDGGSICRN